MIKVPNIILPALIVTAVIGVVFIVSATRVHNPEGEVLGESNEPEGADIVMMEPAQLPENIIKQGTLPTNEVIDRQQAKNDTSIQNKEKNKSTVLAPTPSEEMTVDTVNSNKKIVIRLKSQTMDMVEHGVVLSTFKISSGKRGMQTPTGTFKVLNKNKRAYSKTYGLYMPYWMAFTTRGHGIHELPEWPNGYKEGENHLGTPVSHGCVRLGVGSAQTMFEWAEVGTPIEVIQS